MAIADQIRIQFKGPQSNNASAINASAISSWLKPDSPALSVDEPFLEEISAGKNTYVYDAHTYHTKVPPQGIAQLIRYYTRPGDVIADPFCGSGMTGIAALEEGRCAVLSDLSPAAAFIAEHLTTPIDDEVYHKAVNELLDSAEALERELYTTSCRKCSRPAVMLYTVWSYGVCCPACHSEFVLWDVARDERERVRDSKIKAEFDCPHCGTHLKKRGLKRTKRYPVQIGYRCSCAKGLKEQMAEPNEKDIARINAQAASGLPKDLWSPQDPFPANGVNTRQAIVAGITTVDKAYTPRALHALAFLWREAKQWPNEAIRAKLLFTITSLYQRVTVFSEFRFWGGSGNIANYNVPQIMNEQNVFRAFRRKAETIRWYFREAGRLPRRVNVSVRSATCLDHLPSGSVDYVFTDPPFGSNINYSEMNFLWESWLQSYTDTRNEAIVSAPQGKGVADYESLLQASFSEVHRVLKPNGWLTVVFHNSSEKIWTALQRALDNAGFEVRGAQTFDKKHGTFKMFVSANAVGYDLVIHLRKRNSVLSAKQSIPAPALIISSFADVEAFIRKQLLEGDAGYEVHYQHVNRADEFDYRKLFSEWLTSSFANRTIATDFGHFRQLVDKVRAVNHAS